MSEIKVNVPGQFPRAPRSAERPLKRDAVAEARALVGRQAIVRMRLPARNGARNPDLPIGILALLNDGDDWRLVTDYIQPSTQVNWSPRLSIIESALPVLEPPVVTFS